MNFSLRTSLQLPVIQQVAILCLQVGSNKGNCLMNVVMPYALNQLKALYIQNLLNLAGKLV